MRRSFSWRSWRGTKNFSTAPGLPIPSRPLLFLYPLARVHQEDRSSSLARSRPLLKNVLSKCTLRMCYPSAHSECAIQVRTQERAIQVHTQNVLSKCTVYSCTTSAPPISCTSRSCAPLVHHLYSCTHLVHLYSRALNSCTHLVHHKFRAPLVLVYHSAISCTTA